MVNPSLREVIIDLIKTETAVFELDILNYIRQKTVTILSPYCFETTIKSLLAEKVIAYGLDLKFYLVPTVDRTLAIMEAISTYVQDRFDSKGITVHSTTDLIHACAMANLVDVSTSELDFALKKSYIDKLEEGLYRASITYLGDK